jgi:hypothetical protein
VIVLTARRGPPARRQSRHRRRGAPMQSPGPARHRARPGVGDDEDRMTRTRWPLARPSVAKRTSGRAGSRSPEQASHGVVANGRGYSVGHVPLSTIDRWRTLNVPARRALIWFLAKQLAISAALYGVLELLEHSWWRRSRSRPSPSLPTWCVGSIVATTSQLSSATARGDDLMRHRRSSQPGVSVESRERRRSRECSRRKVDGLSTAVRLP